MIVLDASAAIALLKREPGRERIEQRVLANTGRLHAPHLIDLEVTQVLRRFVRAGSVGAAQAIAALDAWGALAVTRHGHQSLLRRIWELRDALTAYDAAYVALAEMLDAPLLTCDAKLAGAAGHAARIELAR